MPGLTRYPWTETQALKMYCLSWPSEITPGQWIVYSDGV